MIIPQKNHFFAALFLLAAAINTSAMEPAAEPKKKKKNKAARIAQNLRERFQQFHVPSLPNWTLFGGEVLLGYIPTNQIASIQTITEPFPFTTLNKDIRAEIIKFLAMATDKKILDVAVDGIRSLSLVNHEFHALINNPQFSIALTHHISNNFNCSNQLVARMISSPATDNQLRLQEEFKELCSQAKSLTDFTIGYALSELTKKGFDLNFTSSLGVTPLLFSMPFDSRISRALIALGADPESQDMQGNTPLSLAQDLGDDELVRAIKKSIAKK